MGWNRDAFEDISKWRLKTRGQMDQETALQELDEILRWHMEHRHIATEYPEGVCKCEHRYCDGSCHINCPECNPEGYKTDKCPLPKK